MNHCDKGLNSTMPDPGGRLDIRLERTNQGLVCDLTSTRPVSAASAFIGRSPQETSTRLPLLFSICARAQSAACAMAFEQALGIWANPDAQGRRERAIALETLREHLWRILLDWPLTLQDPPERSAMANVIGQANRILARLDPAGDLFEPGIDPTGRVWPKLDDLIDPLGQLLQERVFGVAPRTWLDQVETPAALADWMRETDTPAARLLRMLVDSGESKLGDARIEALPDLSDAELNTRLSGPDAANFVARPTWNGQPCETSPLTRRADRPLLRGLVAVHGHGLLPRLAAQLVEVATCARVLAEDGTAARAAPAPRSPPAAGVGIGRAQAARGLLVHRVEVRDDRVLDYRILAPTEWNFHPDGVVAKALAGLPVGPDEALRRQAELIVTAVDPCVAFGLIIR
jgi:hypothetical protein